MNLNYKKKRLYLFLSVRISFSSKVSLRLYLETERWTFVGIANFNLFTWPLTLSKKNIHLSEIYKEVFENDSGLSFGT